MRDVRHPCAKLQLRGGLDLRVHAAHGACDLDQTFCPRSRHQRRALQPASANLLPCCRNHATESCPTVTRSSRLGNQATSTQPSAVCRRMIPSCGPTGNVCAPEARLTLTPFVPGL